MTNSEQLKGSWNQVKGRLLERWGQLTDDDLQQFRGSTHDLIGAVQKRTGETRSEIERFLNDAISEGQSLKQRAVDTTQRYAKDVSQYASENFGECADATKDFSRQVARSVKRHPAESIALAFGVGLLAGAVLFMRRNRH